VNDRNTTEKIVLPLVETVEQGFCSVFSLELQLFGVERMQLVEIHLFALRQATPVSTVRDGSYNNILAKLRDSFRACLEFTTFALGIYRTC
jgi:hypothetical protein